MKSTSEWDAARRARVQEIPLLKGLPDSFGIQAVKKIHPAIDAHLTGLSSVLMVQDFPGATLARWEREVIATAVSAQNGCIFCTDSHASFASELLARDKVTNAEMLVCDIRLGSVANFPLKLQALLAVAEKVRKDARELSELDIAKAREAGATDGDMQLTIFIASLYSMYNRLVDGFRAKIPDEAHDYHSLRAKQIATSGYDASSKT